MQIIKVKRKCPYCKEFKVIKKGKYFVHSKPHWRQRYSCLNCKRYFNHFRMLNKGKVNGWDNELYRKIINLINKEGYFSNKYDPREDKTYLSSRGIIRVVKFGRRFRGIRATPQTVSKLIKIHRAIPN